MVQHHCLIPFSLGNHFEDEVWCDVLPIKVCHLLRGQPWLFDRKMNYNRHGNTYSLTCKKEKLISKPLHIKEFQQNSTMILSLQGFQRTLLENLVVFMLVCKAIDKKRQPTIKVLPATLQHLLQQFEDVFPKKSLSNYHLYMVYNIQLIWFKVLHFQNFHIIE